MLLHVGMATHSINCYSTAHTVGDDRGSDIDGLRQHGTKTGNLVLRTAQGTEVPTRSMASTTYVPASRICGGSHTIHPQCSLQIKAEQDENLAR